MPFSSGTYTPAYNFITEAGTPPVELTTLDLQMTDIATALSNCILRDGTGVTTAAIPFAYAINIAVGGSTFYESYKGINTAKGVATQDTGSFTATLTGCTTSPTTSVVWSRTGNVVVLNIQSVSATSNTTACTLTGLPAALQPARAHRCAAMIIDTGTAAMGLVDVHISGTITLFAGAALSATGFTNSGTKGTSVFTIVYSLD